MRAMRQVVTPAPVKSSGPTTGDAEVAAIRKKLKHFTVQAQPECWLAPGYSQAAEVFGDISRGIPYGKIYEVCGRYSGGKTAIVQELAAYAQQVDNAHVAWVDLESSWDAEWATIRGLDTDKVAVFGAEILKDNKNNMHIAHAEEIFEEAEAWVKMKFEKDPNCKIFIAVDSITAILPQQEADAGLQGKARGVLAAFLSKMLRRWAPIVRTHHAMMFLVNQIRTNPGVAFGDPEYRPGGSALDHYTSVITKVKRTRGKSQGWMIGTNGTRLGIKTTILNQKNKVGGQEGIVVGCKVYWKKRAKFLDASEIENT